MVKLINTDWLYFLGTAFFWIFKDEILHFKKSWGTYLSGYYCNGTKLIIIFPGSNIKNSIIIIKKRIFTTRLKRGIWIKHHNGNIERVSFESWEKLRILTTPEIEFKNE